MYKVLVSYNQWKILYPFWVQIGIGCSSGIGQSSTFHFWESAYAYLLRE